MTWNDLDDLEYPHDLGNLHLRPVPISHLPMPALLVFNWLRIRRISAPHNFNVINYHLESQKNRGSIFHGFTVRRSSKQLLNLDSQNNFMSFLSTWITMIRTVWFSADLPAAQHSKSMSAAPDAPLNWSQSDSCHQLRIKTLWFSAITM